jgi:hypothetical protein
MRKRLTRQTGPRTVVSLSMPHRDWIRSNRAAGMSGETLAEFIREAAKRRTSEVIGEDPPLDAAA